MPATGSKADEVRFLFLAGSELLVDDLLLFEPAEGRRLELRAGGGQPEPSEGAVGLPIPASTLQLARAACAEITTQRCPRAGLEGGDAPAPVSSPCGGGRLRPGGGFPPRG